MSNEPIWQTKDGRKIPLSEMEDRHLLNCLRMTQNNITQYNEMMEWGSDLFFGPRGEYAQLAFEDELDNMMEVYFNSAVWEKLLTREVERRGLTPLKPREHRHPPKVEKVENLGNGLLLKLAN